MSYPKEPSLSANDGGTSQTIAISTASAASTALTSDTVLIYSTINCFMRRGVTPVALSGGTDQFIASNSYLRIDNIRSGDKLAFITASGTGSVYLTPGA